MGRTRKSFVAVAALAVSLIVCQANAGLVVLDDFAAGVNLNTIAPPPVVSSATNDGSHAGVLGNFRDTSLFAASGGISVLYSPIMANTLFFASLPGSTGSYTSVYDGFGTGGSLGANLNSGNSDRFAVGVVTSDASGLVEITVTDTGGNSATVARLIQDSVVETLEFLFSDYAGVNAASVRSISLKISSADPGADFTLGALSTIPEPASLSLLCLGSLALLRRSRKKRLVI